jgi:O-antigen/teichoic acid export membrane protein
MQEQPGAFRVIALSMGKIFTALSWLLILAVLSRCLTKSDYASYQQTILVFKFAGPILSLGIYHGLYYFVAKENTGSQRYIPSALLMLFISGGIFGFAMYTVGNRFIADHFNNPSLQHTLKYFSAYAFCTLPSGILCAQLVIKNKTTFLALYYLCSSTLTVMIVSTVALFTKNIYLIVISQTASAALLLIPVLLLIYNNIKPYILPSLNAVNSLLTYCIPLGLSTVIGTLSLQLDKLIVSSICKPETFAIYSNGAIEIPLIGIISGSISTIMLVDMKKSISKGDKRQALKLFQLAAEKSALFLMPLLCLLMICSNPFIELIFSKTYMESVTIFRIYLLLLPARIVYYGPALMAFGKTRTILFRSILNLVINLIFTLILVKKIGSMGAAIATIITIYLWDILYNIWALSKSFKTSFLSILPLQRLGIVFVLCLIPALPTFFAVNYLKTSRPFYQLLGASFFYGTAILILFKKYNLLSLEDLKKISNFKQ